jgi:hypothetical protein
MLYEIAKELDAAFKVQHVPFPVVFGPELVKNISSGREHVSIEYVINEKRDSVSPPKATHANPPVPFNLDQAVRLRIYARSNVGGATWANHSRRAKKVLRHALAELDIVVRVKRQNAMKFAGGGFVTLEDDKGTELFNGAVYELDFSIDSSVPRVNWEDEANDEVVLGTDFDLVHTVKVDDEIASGGP